MNNKIMIWNEMYMMYWEKSRYNKIPKREITIKENE